MSAAKPGAERSITVNRKARHEYHLDQEIEAGLVLMGTEVKALRMGRASLSDGWVSLERGEAWLEGVHIPEYLSGSWTNHSPRRKRKLLLHKDEIKKLEQRTREKGVTVVPLRLYFSGSRAKVTIAVAHGKREWDKRQELRRRQDDMEARKAMRHRANL
ncbi:MAG: SsrA-binding protein SmpB [Micrococcales bacterium]|nr:SsrA-binding protein SmpB [Micrococcales bacterium]